VIDAPRLIALSDRSRATAERTLERFERLANAARPGTVLLQLRDRELSALERLAFGRRLKLLALATGQGLAVNDRLDLALLLGADGVHLAESSVSAADARHLLGAGCFVTRACHGPSEAAEASVDGWVLSPILEARKERPALGLGRLSELRARLPIVPDVARAPALYALGGVDAGRARACLEAGATGIAVIGAVLAVEDPLPLLDALDIVR
jgi:thiamine-phosphate pyrophosphorylase